MSFLFWYSCVPFSMIPIIERCISIVSISLASLSRNLVNCAVCCFISHLKFSLLIGLYISIEKKWGQLGGLRLLSKKSTACLHKKQWHYNHQKRFTLLTNRCQKVLAAVTERAATKYATHTTFKWTILYLPQ